MRLAALTTLRLGGSAERVVTVETEDELVGAVRDDPTLLLAGGSNVVLADEDLPGTVVLVRTRGVAVEDERARRRRGRAMGRGRRVLRARRTAGRRVPVRDPGLDRRDADPERRRLRAGRVRDGRVGTGLRPRDGRGTSDGRGRVRVRLPHERVQVPRSLDGSVRGVPAARVELSGPLRYAELARTLDVPVGGRAPLAEVREAVLGLRRGKGMVIDPGDPDSVSAGSFFTNPILSHEAWSAIPGSPPGWPEPDGRIKTSAAWLIERAGFGRGYGDGRAGISTKHTLALINRGDATTAELMALAREIAAGVQTRFGVALHPEPVLVGHSW